MQCGLRISKHLILPRCRLGKLLPFQWFDRAIRVSVEFLVRDASTTIINSSARAREIHWDEPFNWSTSVYFAVSHATPCYFLKQTDHQPLIVELIARWIVSCGLLIGDLKPDVRERLCSCLRKYFMKLHVGHVAALNLVS
jgi:hypothetical protein